MTGTDNLQRWDIFCRIVDNYGDIGVCWRLARQLAHEHDYCVRLWVDDLAVAQRLIPGIDLSRPSQQINDIEISHWVETFPQTVVADVVIEAFACELPPAYLAAMADSKPIWLNLEYLTAEAWAIDFHLKPSPHPRLPLTKFFFFPGFDAQAGGLLRERGLIDAREAFQRSPQAQAAFCRQLGIDAFGAGRYGTRVSLFCYAHADIGDLLQDMAASAQPLQCLISDPNVAKAAEAWLGRPIVIGQPETRDQLTLQRLPFLSQDDYDRLLWLCDLNFVRGEDSWLRAIWAAKPLIWQPYRQEAQAHLAKLEAFLDTYAKELDATAAQALFDSHRAWAEGRWSRGTFDTLLRQLPALQGNAKNRATQLAKMPDLATKLVIFCKNLF